MMLWDATASAHSSQILRQQFGFLPGRDDRGDRWLREGSRMRENSEKCRLTKGLSGAPAVRRSPPLTVGNGLGAQARQRALQAAAAR